MTTRKLEQLDKLLTELGQDLDREHPLHPQFELIVRIRRLVDARIESAKEPK